MAAKKKQELINLLPQKEFEASTLGRILKWALSTFRIIVIITEMVVMVAFLSRFWLDAQNNDLNDTIRQKQAIITSQASFEKQFKDAQTRLKIFSSLTNINNQLAPILQGIASKIPSTIFLSSYNLSDNLLNIKGVAISELDISQFIVNLDSDKDNFSSVELTELGSSPENQSILSFGIKIVVKGGKI